MTAIDYSTLWGRVSSLLDAALPEWQCRIAGMGQVVAVEAREKGQKWSDNAIFEGIVKAVLSNSTDWSRIERVLPDLRTLFCEFDLESYSKLDESHVQQVLLPWFHGRKAGSMTMKRDLTSLIQGAKQLLGYSCQYGSLESFISALLGLHKGDVAEIVRELGSTSSRHKLPAVGIPIAAEAAKNIGYDIAKPDRHICRAAGCFGLVDFRRWQDQSDRKPPEAKEQEQVVVMRVMGHFAEAIGVRTAFLDNAIWLLCAKSGLHLSNTALKNLAGPAWVLKNRSGED